MGRIQRTPRADMDLEYRVIQGGFEIVRVVHGARHLQDLF